jgi:hypothetical protein
MGITRIVTVTVWVAVMMLVPVVPKLGFVEQEKENQKRQNRGEQHLRLYVRLERLGQQQHEGGGQQGAGGQTEHVLGVARKQPKAQQGSEPDAADTGSQRGQNNGS